MKTANVMAGFSLGEADLLRRAMGKKKPEEMAKQREKFVAGARRLGHSDELAQKIFDLMSEFAKYGFNKSHAAAYAMVTVQTAYLKTYFPEAFYAALLSSESEDTEKLGMIIRNAQMRDLLISPPHVNKSQVDFGLEIQNEKKGIRFGLASIKNFGRNSAKALVEERSSKGEFKDVLDLFERLPQEALNKRQLECLIRSGSADGMGETRATMFASLEGLLNYAQSFGSDKRGGQRSLFSSKPKLKRVPEWTDRIRLNDEKHLLGTYMTGHPMAAFRALLQTFRTQSIADLPNLPGSREAEVSVAGIILSMKEIFTKKGSKMAFFSIEDLEGHIEIVMFPDLYEKKGSLLVMDRVVLVRGNISREGDMVKILARDIQDLSQVEFSELHLKLSDRSQLTHLAEFTEKAKIFPGAIKVKVHIPVSGQVEGKVLQDSHVTIETEMAIQTHPELMNWLDRQFGSGTVSLQ